MNAQGIKQVGSPRRSIRSQTSIARLLCGTLFAAGTMAVASHAYRQLETVGQTEVLIAGAFFSCCGATVGVLFRGREGMVFGFLLGLCIALYNGWGNPSDAGFGQSFCQHQQSIRSNDQLVVVAVQVSFGDDREVLFPERLHCEFDVFDHDCDGWFPVGTDDQRVGLNDIQLCL